MANRRLAAFAEQYLRYMLQSRLADQQAAAVYDRQERNARLQEGRELQRLALADTSGRVANLTGQRELVPSPETLFQDLGQSITGAKSMGDLPTAPDLRAQASRKLTTAGYDPAGAIDTFTGRHIGPMRSAASEPTDGALPSRSLLPAERPDIASLIAQREGKREAISAADEYEVANKGAEAFTTGLEGVLGRNQGEQRIQPDVIQRANETSAAKNTQEIANELAQLAQLGGPRAAQVRREAFARGQGGASGTIAGQYANLDKLKEITTSQQLPTDTQRRVAGQLSPLVSAHSKLTELANSGQGLVGGIQTVMANPVMMNSAAAKAYYSPEDFAFGQAAAEWGNIAGYIISGVAVRQDERGNFITAMVENKNDPPQLKAQKQRAREAFLTAAQISAGHAGSVAGAALAAAVKDGTLPATVAQMLQMEPEVLAGFEAELTR